MVFDVVEDTSEVAFGNVSGYMIDFSYMILLLLFVKFRLDLIGVISIWFAEIRGVDF